MQLRTPLGQALFRFFDLGAGVDARPRRRQIRRHLRRVGATLQHLQDSITGCRMREHGCSREYKQTNNRQR